MIHASCVNLWMQTSDISFLHIRRFGDRDTKVSITKCYNEYNNCIIVHFKISDPKNRVYFFYFSSALNLKKKNLVKLSKSLTCFLIFYYVIICHFLKFIFWRPRQSSPQYHHCVMVSAKQGTRIYADKHACITQFNLHVKKADFKRNLLMSWVY